MKYENYVAGSDVRGCVRRIRDRRASAVVRFVEDGSAQVRYGEQVRCGLQGGESGVRCEGRRRQGQMREGCRCGARQSDEGLVDVVIGNDERQGYVVVIGNDERQGYVVVIEQLDAQVRPPSKKHRYPARVSVFLRSIAARLRGAAAS